MTAYRMVKAVESGSLNVSNLVPVSETLRIRERWKYAEVEKYLRHSGIRFKFEFEIGEYIFDLALLEKKVLVEFDGPEHRKPSGEALDAVRDEAAVQAGWRVARVPVPKRSVILPSVLYDILAA